MMCGIIGYPSGRVQSGPILMAIDHYTQQPNISEGEDQT